MNTEKKECTLRIQNIVPFFIWQFGINLPNNLKPKIKTINDLNLSEDDLRSEEKIVERVQKLIELKEKESLLYCRYRFDCFKKCRAGCLGFYGLEWDTKNLLKKPIDFLDFTEYWTTNPKITWLSNKSERQKEKEIIGIRANQLEKIDENLFQIGMQSTSSKEYFRYVSTTEKRKVNIRIVLFNQYKGIQNLGNKSEFADFFIRFDKFENLLAENYESMIFHLDEYGERYFKLTTKEGSSFIEKDFGFDIDFESWMKKIKTGQNNA